MFPKMFDRLRTANAYEALEYISAVPDVFVLTLPVDFTQERI